MSQPHANPTALPTHVRDAALARWRATAKQQWVRINGESMRPILRAGDAVLVAHGQHALRRGDLCVFRQHEELVVHRVLRGTGGNSRTLLTRGDNTRRCDAPVSPQQIVGRVLQIQRNGRVIALDLPFARISGGLIASVLLLSARLRPRLLKAQPAWLITPLRHTVAACGKGMLQIVQMLLWRRSA